MDNGKENGNCYLGFRVLSSGVRAKWFRAWGLIRV